MPRGFLLLLFFFLFFSSFFLFKSIATTAPQKILAATSFWWDTSQNLSFITTTPMLKPLVLDKYLVKFYWYACYSWDLTWFKVTRLELISSCPTLLPLDQILNCSIAIINFVNTSSLTTFQRLFTFIALPIPCCLWRSTRNSTFLAYVTTLLEWTSLMAGLSLFLGLAKSR